MKEMGYIKEKGLRMYKKEFQNGILKNIHIVRNDEVYSIADLKQFLNYYNEQYAQRLEGMKNTFNQKIFQ
jgi:hypothetical protein